MPIAEGATDLAPRVSDEAAASEGIRSLPLPSSLTMPWKREKKGVRGKGKGEKRKKLIDQFS
jgi:hypothetical protein